MDIFHTQTCQHCLGPGCLHCREKRAEAAARPRRSQLTPDERRELGLMPLRGLRFDVPGRPQPRKPTFGLSVLPFNFVLTGHATITRRCR